MSPDRINTSSWIRHVLGKHISERELSAAVDLHISGLHRDDKTARVKVKPAGQAYITKLALEELSPEQANKLDESHAAMEPHALDPENEWTRDKGSI